MKFKLPLLVLLVSIQSFGQMTDNKEKIKNLLENYFHYDRENIHVQFNKTIYVNNEDIAFKGYVFSKNNKTPHYNTTNVQLVIYNEKEEIILRQLLFASKGTFTGGLHLNDKFKSGRYTFHFYTNWMNNFKEDDSFTQTIEIINKNEPYHFKSSEPNWKTAKVTFTPEGGAIIDGILNNVGVSITDCNNKGIEIKDAVIVDSKSKEITRFNTNKMGNGLIYFNPDLNETYTLKIKTDKLTISQNLPKVQETGLAISYNNNLPNNILALAIKTNDKGFKLYQNKKIIILIHQNDNSVQKQFTFDDQTKQVLFDKKYLSNGVNSIRLIDENLNELSERLVYIYGTNKATTTLEAKTAINDSVILSGRTDVKQANLSVSILPENNVGLDQKRSILGTYYLNAYLENPKIDNYAYYDSENKDKKQDMELLMLNQNRSKFLWENIKSFSPKFPYEFKKGITIAGKVELKPNSKLDPKNKISLISFKNNVYENTSIEKDGSFKFENFYAQDSAVFIFQMVNEKRKPIFAKIDTKITPLETVFLLPLQFERTNCPIEKNPENSFTFSPKLGKDAINLETVTVTAKPKEVLTHKNEMSQTADSYKIDQYEYGNILEFIGRHGYTTGINLENQTAYIRNSRDIGLENAPAVYLNNQQVYDFNFLNDIYMNTVDEVYIDKTGSSDISANSSGTIKIFLKMGSDINYSKVKHSTLTVKNAFTKNIEFKNAPFETQKEFYYFGTLNWTPNITIKDNPNYEIKFPKGNQKEIKVFVEGFSDDGQLISEEQKIPIKTNE